MHSALVLLYNYIALVNFKLFLRKDFKIVYIFAVCVHLCKQYPVKINWNQYYGFLFFLYCFNFLCFIF